MASIPNLFDDPSITELAGTTVGEARADAPTSKAVRQVEENANLERQAAEQTASVARTKGRRLTGEMPTSVDKVRNVPGQPVKEPLDQAVDEGKRDVAQLQAIGAEKLGQVKDMAAKATPSAQGAAQGQSKSAEENTSSGGGSGGILPTLQGVAENVVGTATDTLSSTVGTATSTLQNVLGTSGAQESHSKGTPASSTGIPATSAPLESAGKKLDTMYPQQGGKDVAQTQPKSSN
ncbi:hypothetical protein NP233_g6008 [Leucocoprinus birnbaumii]|uniref:Uncharacterized protein n=1 Tax=Leucocoprinus birnbaumii TaxID=56174 RepID=A0AAD5VRS4_9AGAR|nr:hypothetical protein NP233_g6008 [Leucocoprinus birnbaumii]